MGAMAPKQATFWDDPGPRRNRGRARRGLDDTIRALRSTGRLEESDTAEVALCRVLADLLDDADRDPEESRYVCATIGGRYLTALVAFRSRVLPVEETDALDELLAGVLDPAHRPAN